MPDDDKVKNSSNVINKCKLCGNEWTASHMESCKSLNGFNKTLHNIVVKNFTASCHSDL